MQLFDDTASENTTVFADILLPIPIPRHFTYRVPADFLAMVQVGCRVIVQFGQKKILTGVVANIHQQPPQAYESRNILEVLDEQPIISTEQFRLFRWMAEYYMCTEGEVLAAALPSGFKLNSESRIQIHPDFNLESSSWPMADDELLLLEQLEQQESLNYTEAADIIKAKNLHKIIKSLLAKEAILLFESVKDKYKPRKEKRIRLSESYVSDKAMQRLFVELDKKEKQEAIVMQYLKEVPVYRHPEKNTLGISKKVLLEQHDLSASSLQTLVKKGIFEAFDHHISRLENINASQASEDIQFSTAQQAAIDSITSAWEEKDTVLLHGVTGSGKTEIYIKLIEEAIAADSQVLFLLPEIALTTQITQRLQTYFGDGMAVFHSKYSDNERVEVYKKVLADEVKLVVGVRSSLFLPFRHLGLIIVDEEHETSYKQHDPAPRYQARDTALLLATLHHAKTILGSATPSLESYFLTKDNKYAYVHLLERFGGASLPKMDTADMTLARKQKTMKAHFTPELVGGIKLALENKEQVLIFQNRRGYAPFLSCDVCSWIPKCEHCSVSLTYHLYKNELRCHYCGYKSKTPAICGACGSTEVKMMSHGTEKLEDDLKIIFPDARIERMDLDTTRKKYSYQEILERFDQGETDILVGTQMISKGLDFNRVSLVGIVDADRLINFPDFRAAERAFQMITQVSGRAGRRKTQGKVIIQTGKPEQEIIGQIISHAYTDFMQQELSERHAFRYPPYERLIRITIRHKTQETAEKAAIFYFNLIFRKSVQVTFQGPFEPIVYRIKNQYQQQILIKLSRSYSGAPKLKSFLWKEMENLLHESNFKSCRVVFDVDPS